MQEWFLLSLLEIDSLVLKKKIFLNFVNVFSQFRNDLPLRKGVYPLFEQTRIPFTQECFVLCLVEIS